MMCIRRRYWRLVFFFNDTATTEIYTLSLHDALPIGTLFTADVAGGVHNWTKQLFAYRSEEHTSELQSRVELVCRLLLEKKQELAPTTLADFLSREQVMDIGIRPLW